VFQSLDISVLLQKIKLLSRPWCQTPNIMAAEKLIHNSSPADGACWQRD